MHCRNCRRPWSPGARVCPTCGAQNAAVIPPPLAPQTTLYQDLKPIIKYTGIALAGIFALTFSLAVIGVALNPNPSAGMSTAPPSAPAPAPVSTPTTTAPTAPTAVSAPVNKWRIGRGESSFDDSQTVVLSLTAELSINGWLGKTATPTLVLRCKERKTEAYIQTGMVGQIHFGEYGSDEGTLTRARYDKGPVRKYIMGKSTDGEAYFYSRPVEEMRLMTRHEEMVMEFTPFNANPQEIRFDLRGLSEELPRIRAVCKW